MKQIAIITDPEHEYHNCRALVLGSHAFIDETGDAVSTIGVKLTNGKMLNLEDWQCDIHRDVALHEALTRTILDQLIQEWESMDTWNGFYPYCGICEQIEAEIGVEASMDFYDYLLVNYHDRLDSHYLKPDEGIEGVQVRIEILKEIRDSLDPQ